MLHMNFQKYVMLWALFVALSWCTLIVFVDPALAILGTRKFGSPRDNCILVAWGYETQQRLMWTKVTFLVVVYTLTFIGCLLHGVRQLRIYQVTEAKCTTMGDFAAIIKGLPSISGSVSEKTAAGGPSPRHGPEDELTVAVSKATGQSVVGVSVCWSYTEKEERVNEATNDMVYDCESTDKAKDEAAANAETTMNPVRRSLFAVEQYLFDEEDHEDDTKEQIVEMLNEMVSSGEAFVVFNSEKERDEAIKKVESEGIKFRDTTLQLDQVDCEPDTVNWQNFGEAKSQKMMRLCLGFAKILAA